jgi:hypothetical protein
MPGMLLKHYSPRAPLTILRGMITHIQAYIVTMTQHNPSVAWLCYDDDIAVAQQAQIAYASLGCQTMGRWSLLGYLQPSGSSMPSM